MIDVSDGLALDLHRFRRRVQSWVLISMTCGGLGATFDEALGGRRGYELVAGRRRSRTSEGRSRPEVATDKRVLR